MKTPGQVAHAAFCESIKAFRPFGVRAAEWSELTDTVRQAWEAAAQAVMSPPHVEAPSDKLTEAHLEALRRFAASHGVTWRIRLRAAWEADTLTNYTSAVDAYLLQRVRNILSPSGLAALRL